MRMKFHIGSIIILICGLCALIPGLMVLFGMGGWVHEVLDQPIGGIALLAIGLCGVLAAVFPLLVKFLTQREHDNRPEK